MFWNGRTGLDQISELNLVKSSAGWPGTEQDLKPMIRNTLRFKYRIVLQFWQ